MNSIIFFFAGAIALLSLQQSHVSGLLFDHSKHFTELEIECIDCHDVSKSSDSDDRNIPGMEICRECHAPNKARDDCAFCHTDPNNPTGIRLSKRQMQHSHEAHVAESTNSEICLTCHKDIDKATVTSSITNYPKWDDCFKCHEGESAASECSINLFLPVTLAESVHQPDWQHEHQYSANHVGQECAACHHSESFCTDCHTGDNLVETVHGLNYRFTHGIDAKGKEHDCQSCHDYESFCSTCHQDDSKPLNHRIQGWQTAPYFHAEEARNDIESCAACHSGDLSICARCHSEGGYAGSIHMDSMDDFGEGPWHEDRGYYCFDCHTNTNSAGVGFCGNCHGAEVE